MQPRLGLLLAMSLTTMGGLLFLDIAAAEFGRSSDMVHGPSEFRDEGFTTISTVQAGPGDVVRIPIPTYLPAPFESYHLVAVPGGAGALPNPPVLDEASGTRSTSGQPLYVTVPAGADGVDIVRVFTYDRTAPAGEAEAYFQAWVRAAAAQVPATAESTSARAVLLHRVVAPTLWMLAAVSVGLGGFWLRHAWVSGQSAEGMEIVELGIRTLRFLGSLLWWMMPLLFVGSWALLIFFWNVQQQLPGFGEDWTASLRAASIVLLLSAAGGWAMLMARVTRARRRWDVRAQQFPLA